MCLNFNMSNENSLTISKLNVVAFVREKESPMSMSSARPSPWVEIVPQQEMFDGYSGWGNDTKIILQHMKQPSRWSIHTLYPPLETFVNGRIVLVGDAVSYVSSGIRRRSHLFLGTWNASASRRWCRARFRRCLHALPTTEPSYDCQVKP